MGTGHCPGLTRGLEEWPSPACMGTGHCPGLTRGVEEHAWEPDTALASHGQWRSMHGNRTLPWPHLGSGGVAQPSIGLKFVVLLVEGLNEL